MEWLESFMLMISYFNSPVPLVALCDSSLLPVLSQWLLLCDAIQYASIFVEVCALNANNSASWI